MNTLQLQSYSLAMNSVHFYLQQTSHVLLSCDRSELHKITGDGTVPFCAEKGLRKKTVIQDADEWKRAMEQKCFVVMLCRNAQRYVFVSEEMGKKLKNQEAIELASCYPSSGSPISMVKTS